MKRIIATLLTLVLLVALACPALAEKKQTFTTAYYTLSVPESWDIDTGDLDKEGDYEELGVLQSAEDPGLVIEAGLGYYESLSDVSLWNADDETIQLYIESIEEDFEDENPEYVTTLYAGSVPFIVMHLEDDDGPYYYIDTMTNGYAVIFYAYVASAFSDDTQELSDADWAELEAILTSFQPVM